MSAFDIAAGLALGVSVLVGWFRGGAREVTGAAAFVVSGAVAFATLRLAARVAGHFIHTPWLASLAAGLVVFAATYALLNLIGGALARLMRRSTVLGAVDHTLGAAFGLARALALLGVAALGIGAVIPPARTPRWISDAALYPLARASAQTLEAMAPGGVKLARHWAPAVQHASLAPSAAQPFETRRYYMEPAPALGQAWRLGRDS